MITEQQREEYLKRCGVACPVCLSTNIQGESIDSGAGRATQEMGCNNCNAEWTDVYTLTGLEE